jgi:hypothetical protein
LIEEKTMDKMTDTKPMPGYKPQRTGNDKPEFASKKGEGQVAAGARLRDEVRSVVKRNGGRPADNG